jgi:hypothetical protein
MGLNSYQEEKKVKYRVIGLTGCRGSGKSRFARLLCNNSNRLELSFAYPIRKMVKEVYSESGYTGFYEWKRSGRSVCTSAITGNYRHHCNHFGHIINQGIGCYELLKQSMSKSLNNGNTVVVSDVRTEREAHLIHINDGIILEVSNDVSSYTFQYMDSQLPFDLIDNRIYGKSNCQNVADKYNT